MLGLKKQVSPHQQLPAPKSAISPTKTTMKSPTITTTKLSKKSGRRRFIVTSFILIVILCAVASINEICFDSITRCFTPTTTTSTALQHSDQNATALRILIGILTLPDSYHRRDFLRQVYGVQRLPADVRVDVKFVFCNLTKDDQRFLVALEILRYDDIIILNCTENMNNGKSLTFFSALPAILPAGESSSPPYHYVMKSDDDTYVRLPSLAASLRPLPRQDLYYGFVIPCESMDPFHHYMSGMGYLVSWDVAEWISESEIPASRLKGPEDRVFGDWIRGGGRGKNRFNAKWGMYNYPEPPNKCSHELWPETVAVHLLKTPERWMKTLRYFNVTLDLKPSKMYHLT